MKRLLSAMLAVIAAVYFFIIPVSAAEPQWQSVKLDEENFSIGVPAGWAVLYPDMSKDAEALQKLSITKEAAREIFASDGKMKLLCISPDKKERIIFKYCKDKSTKKTGTFRKQNKTYRKEYQRGFVDSVTKSGYQVLNTAWDKIGDTPAFIASIKSSAKNGTEYVQAAAVDENGAEYDIWVYIVKDSLSQSDGDLIGHILAKSSITLLPGFEEKKPASKVPASSTVSETASAVTDVGTVSGDATTMPTNFPNIAKLFTLTYAVYWMLALILILGILCIVLAVHGRVNSRAERRPSNGRDDPDKKQ